MRLLDFNNVIETFLFLENLSLLWSMKADDTMGTASVVIQNGRALEELT